VIDFGKLVQLADAMNREGVEYIVFGGSAVILQGVIRATEDYDIFIRPTVANVEALKRALHAVWDDPCIDEISAEEICDDYPSVRYGPPDDDIYIDFVARLGEAFQYDDLEADVVTMDGVAIRVATPRTLIRMKRGTVRPQDRADAEKLRRKFQIEDE
jgi:hypothetical protein